MKLLLQETDGNLGAQLRKLEDAGYASVTKEFAERKPVSWYAITASGRRALKDHLAALEAQPAVPCFAVPFPQPFFGSFLAPKYVVRITFYSNPSHQTKRHFSTSAVTSGLPAGSHAGDL